MSSAWTTFNCPHPGCGRDCQNAHNLILHMALCQQRQADNLLPQVYGNRQHALEPQTPGGDQSSHHLGQEPSSATPHDSLQQASADILAAQAALMPNLQPLPSQSHHDHSLGLAGTSLAAAVDAAAAPHHSENQIKLPGLDATDPNQTANLQATILAALGLSPAGLSALLTAAGALPTQPAVPPLTLPPQDAGPADGKPCTICHRKVGGEQMREHIGAHVLIERAQGLYIPRCGYCGEDTSTSGKCVPQLSENHQALPGSCSNNYFKKQSAAPMKKDRPACNNYPMRCPGCPHIGWKYHMQDHWNQIHVGQPVPEEFQVREKEKAFMDRIIRVLL